MLIAFQVKKLPEVGAGVVRQAERIDARQQRIDEMQDELNSERIDFLAELRDDGWSDDELRTAGLVLPAIFPKRVK